LKPWQALLLAYGLMVPLVIADLFADPEVHFSVFYLVPVAIAAWRASLRSAIVLSIVSAVTWDAMELMDGTSTDKFWIHIWNLGTRLFFYIVVTVLLHHLRVTMDWLIKISRNDPLTRLLNHSAFIETVDEELLRQQRNGEWVSLAFLDLDHFKQINDQQGHQAGDRALMAVAKVLRGRLRRTDKIGRLGGDEFAILMPETDSAGARAILSPLREMLKNALAREQFQVTFSVGVVSCDYCMDGKRLLQEADALMYEVKRNGRDNLLQREMAG
jgi:diguanylate cyclase (GGDEF)-like protein